MKCSRRNSGEEEEDDEEDSEVNSSWMQILGFSERSSPFTPLAVLPFEICRFSNTTQANKSDMDERTKETASSPSDRKEVQLLEDSNNIRRLSKLLFLKGDHHGCPYKTWSAQQLSAQLSKMQLNSSQVSEIVAKAKAGHYQIACALAFEGTQQCSCDTGINHPNQVKTIS